MTGARVLVYVVTLPLWVVGILGFVLAVALRCVVVLFQIGWHEGENFSDWVFDVKGRTPK